LAGIISSCSHNGKNNDTVKTVTHGFSFNECEGYCIKEMIYSKDKIIVQERQWHNPEFHSDTLKLNKSTWTELLKSFDLEDFSELKNTYGCPDCADGGSEWIEIQSGNKVHKVKFEFGTNDIQEIEELLSAIRELEK
jgi:hypothetical protein